MKKGLKNFNKKLKKQKKSYKIPYRIIQIFYIISLAVFIFLTTIFSTKSFLGLVIGLINSKLGISFAGIIVGIIYALLILFIIYYKFIGAAHIFTKRKGKFVFLLIFTSILAIGLSFGNYIICKTYMTLDTSQKKYVTYTSAMVSMNDTTSYKKLGMINSKNDPTGYILPQEMIKKKNIEGKIVKYDDYISMMNDLYDGNIDALFIQKDYPPMFNSYEKFENIEKETKIVYEYSKEMENINNITYSTKKITEPFTILLMGVDGTGDGISNNGSFNGDSLMLITFNPKTLSATVFSIPRDTYVPISCNGNRENKINSSAYGGTSCVVKTIENLTKIDIDYYMKINFSGVVSLVDDLGGIDVDVPVDFCEQDSLRRFDEYEICLKKGEQKLNGEQALALARHRHSLPLGDFQRVQHQQLVMEAMVNKLKTVKDVDAFYKILSDVTNNIDTNMTTNQMLSFFKVIKNVLTNKVGDNASIDITKTYLTGYDLYMNIAGMGNVYTFQYYKESLADITKAMKVNLELEKPKVIKTFNFSANEKYEETIVGKTYYKEDRKETLPSFVGSNITYLQTWASYRSISVNINEVSENSPLYDDSLADGYILTQSVSAGTEVSKVKSITVSVIKKTKFTPSVVIDDDDEDEKKPVESIESTTPKEPESTTPTPDPITPPTPGEGTDTQTNP